MTREEARKLLFNAHICSECFTPMRRMTVGPPLAQWIAERIKAAIEEKE